MVLYLSIIFISVAILCTLDSIFATTIFGFTPTYIIGAILLSLVVEIAICGLTAFLCHSLPNKWYNPEKKLFKVFKWERKFYEKLGIKKWKDKVWELGALGGFRKNKIDDPSNPDYLTLFLVESNKGMTGHIVSCFLGFLVILLYPKYIWIVGFPIAIVSVLLNTLSTLVLRYNIPKLMVARKRAIQNRELALKKKQEENN